jgi:hypothetical protein
MFVRYGNKSIEIKDESQAISLEKKFNLTDNGKVWRKIGDALFWFKDIEVDAGQFYFVRDLANSQLSPSSFSVVL